MLANIHKEFQDWHVHTVNDEALPSLRHDPEEESQNRRGKGQRPCRVGSREGGDHVLEQGGGGSAGNNSRTYVRCDVLTLMQ